jgi:hypothetical protein
MVWFDIDDIIRDQQRLDLHAVTVGSKQGKRVLLSVFWVPFENNPHVDE